MVRFYLRNTLISPALPAGILALVLIMLVSGDFTDDLMYCYQHSICLAPTGYFIPVVTVLPICLVQRQMGAGNTQYACLIRSSRRSFSGGALLGAVLSGMAVTLGAFLLFAVFCAIRSFPPTIGLGMHLYPADNPFYAALNLHPVLLYLVMGGVFVLNGSLWPAISLLCWSFTPNQYVALAAPFVIKVAVSWSTQFLGLYFLDPAQLLLKGVLNQTFGGGVPYVLIYCAVVIAVCGIIWDCTVRRRLRHG